MNPTPVPELKRRLQEASEAAAESFLKALPTLREDTFDSIGLGRDLRYMGTSGVGSALLVEGTPVHASFFSIEEGRETSSRPMRRASISQRRGFLME